MIIAPIVGVSSYSDVMKILRSRGLADEVLAHVGFIAYQDKKPIACGFLRQVEGGKIGIIGEVATINDPKVKNTIKHQAVVGIVEDIIKVCKQKHIEHLFAFTKLTTIYKLAKRLNFVSLADKHHVCLVLDT